MDKATPDSALASVDSVMALAAAHSLEAYRDGQKGDNRRSPRHFKTESDLRAEVERLAAQAAGAPAVRMPKEVHVQADTIEDIKRAFSELSADKRIPADGKIGGV